MFNNRAEAVAEDTVCEVGEAADNSDSNHQRNGAEPLIPMSIVERAMVLVLNGAEQELTDNAKDVDRGDNNRSGSNDCESVAEEVTVAEHGVVDVGSFERAEEDGHFGNETAKTRQTERSETGNDVTHRKERHDLHQAAHFADVTSVRTTVNHTDEGEEERSHQAVREHLHK